MSDVSPCSAKEYKRNWNGVYYSSVLEEYGRPLGATWGGQGRMQAERWVGSGVHTFIGVGGWSALGV